jgi:hypothetical protein
MQNPHYQTPIRQENYFKRGDYSMMEELPYIESRINDLFKQFFSSCKVLLKRNCDVIQK